MNAKKYTLFDVLVAILMIALILIWLLPFVHILAVSFSGKEMAAANRVLFLPRSFTLENYRVAFKNTDVARPLALSLFRVVVGTLINLTLVILAAYPLSKDKSRFPGRGIYAGFFIFAMVFNGGLIPGYLLLKALHLLNTPWGLALIGSVQIFYVILLMNFFRQIPADIEEAAMIDGSGPFCTLMRIYLPLAVPSIATITMMAIMRHWNDWFSGLVYMSSNNYPYATYLKTLLDLLNSGSTMNSEMSRMMATTSYRGLKMCYIVIAMLPIMCVFPFLQKHVKKGLTIGSVKG